jgi:hypothetical protein
VVSKFGDSPPIFKETLYEFSTKKFQLLLFVVRVAKLCKKRRRKEVKC